MKVHIIANPASGGGRSTAKAEALRRALEPRVDAVELFITQAAGDGGEMAAASDADCLVSVGGDGTTNEILNGMDRDRAALAILPMGTANVVARELGLKAEPARLADLIARRESRRIDAGRINGRLFLLGVGAGLDAAVTKRVSEAASNASGFARWIGPAIKTVLHFNYAPIRVKVNGETVSETTPYAVVGNCRFSAGVFSMTPRATLNDGRLDVCALHRLNLLKLAWLSAAVWSPHFPERGDVVYRQAETIELEPASDLPVPVQVDGDAAGFLPVTCEAVAAAVEVIAPA